MENDSPTQLPFVIDRRDTGRMTDDGFSASVSQVHLDMIYFLKNDKLASIFAEKPATVADMLSPQGGGTIESITREYFHYRAARLELCDGLRRYIAAVDADEARRNAEDTDSVLSRASNTETA